jgi:nitroimidazol reductase NimA-like FMN-containing flavoprotein (pyridoxamine 5'-phosphate oxidase superfamily)
MSVLICYDGSRSAGTHADSTSPSRPEAPSVLARAECLELLGAARFGRLAVSNPDRPPVIRPVHYVFDQSSQSVVFRSSHGSKLGALLRSGKASFEIDGLDRSGTSGWSVVIAGVAEEITGPAEIERLQSSGLESWAPGDRHSLVRIRAFTVSGRRVTRAGGALSSP